MEHDQAEAAAISLGKLRGTSTVEIQAELDEIHANILWHKEHSVTSAKVFVQEKALWSRLWRAWALSFLQQMSGASGIRYYLPTNFEAAGTSKSLGLLASGIDGTVQVACTIGAMFFIDRIGRRHSLGIGAIIMAFCLMVCPPKILESFFEKMVLTRYNTDQRCSATGLPKPVQLFSQLLQHFLHLLLHCRM